MRLIAVLLVVALAGCTTAPFRVFMGEYNKEGMTEAHLRADRNYCSEESMKFMRDTPATGNLSSYWTQKFMLKCMKEKGYESVSVHPGEFDDPFSVGKP